MANTFTKKTKSSLLTADVTSSATTNVVTAGGTSTLIILSIANANIYLVPNSGDAAFLIKNAPVPAGSSLEMISGSKIIMNASDVLRASSDTATALDITISYLEQN